MLHRTCARCGCEYEWGVHAVAFGRPLGFTDEQLRATVHGDADDPAWSERQRCWSGSPTSCTTPGTVSDALWSELAADWDPRS